MVRRTKVDGNRVWGLCFRLQGDPTSRTITHILPEADAPDLADFTDEELLATLEPRSAARAELEPPAHEADDVGLLVGHRADGVHAP